MHFDTNQLMGDAKVNCDNLSTCNGAEYTSGSDDDEFIDVETIQPHNNSTCRTQVWNVRIEEANWQKTKYKIVLSFCKYCLS